MESAPRGLRRHIAILGSTNAGKSTLFNLLTGQEAAIVSPVAGTTTDPVMKNMELLPFGPVTLIDTAGLNDTTELGEKRAAKTREALRRADLGIVVQDANACLQSGGDTVEASPFKGKKLYVFTKRDLLTESQQQELQQKYPLGVFLSSYESGDIERLKKILSDTLSSLEEESDTMVGNLLDPGATVVLVVPVDSEAPKGRLILPQVQLIRDCLDHGMKAMVTRETELSELLKDLPQVDLVVTDSQAFGCVNEIVPEQIPLTSFSMLLAMQKGNFSQLLAGVEGIPHLKEGDRILVLEGCTHNHNHEDIGRVKIPRLMQKYTGRQLSFDFYSGYHMPESLEGYAMALLCGSCMLNPAEVKNRLEQLALQGIPASNYGIVLAYLNGILNRCRQIFDRADAAATADVQKG